MKKKLLATMLTFSFYMLHYGSQYFIGLYKKENVFNKNSVHFSEYI